MFAEWISGYTQVLFGYNHNSLLLLGYRKGGSPGDIWSHWRCLQWIGNAYVNPIPTQRNLHVMNTEMNLCILPTARSLFLFLECDSSMTQEMIHFDCLWMVTTVHFRAWHHDDNGLCTIQIAYLTQLDLLHDELAFTMRLQEDTCAQLHPAVSGCCGWRHTSLLY